MKKSFKFKKLFNKRGMTYVELLVAMSLLMLIIVSFTPMLLSSYESLYKAGETTEQVYDSQKTIEEGLAVRSSINVQKLSLSFQMNAEAVFENMNVSGRKVVSDVTKSLESLFYGVRARVDIITSTHVNDDRTSHEIILQTTGLEYNTVTTGVYSGNLEDLPQSQVHIDAFIPDKDQASEEGTTTDEVVYSTTRASFSDVSYNAKKGRISFTLSGSTEPLDFTQSPVKILVYYKNERGFLKTLCDYLYIDPPTIMVGGNFAGAGVDYITSAGVEEKQDEDSEEQQSVFTLNAEPRQMRIVNSGYLVNTDRPSQCGTSIQTITWVDEDENNRIAPYYVMAGTNSRVYRMYRYNAMDLTPQSVLGSQNSVTNTTDLPYDLADGSRVYQDFWSGDMSDRFVYRTQSDGAGYGNTADNKHDCSATTNYNALDKNLRYFMAFSGFRTGYSYRMQASRRISYVLTEAGNKSFRLAGKKGAVADFAGHTGHWEPTDHYLNYNNNKSTMKTTDERPIYLYDGSYLWYGSKNRHYEKHFAWLSAASYTSVNLYDAIYNASDTSTQKVSLSTLNNAFRQKFYGDMGDDGDYAGYFWPNKGDDADYRGNGGCIIDTSSSNAYIKDPISTGVSTIVNVTSSAYFPGAGSNGQGQVIYFGYVPAYSLVKQSSDIGEADTYVYNFEDVVASRPTLYYVHSNGHNNNDGSGATIYRRASLNYNDLGPVGDAMKTGAGVTTISTATEFYTLPNAEATYAYTDNELKFTFGYCSRWRMALGQVTSNGTTEATKSYEGFYTLSHTNEVYDRVPSGGLNTGSVDNLYYNVWFPGEHYTITQTATCDGVTVGCGYTVSGSTFMEQSAIVSGYYGTALGSIYNDGVLSAYIDPEYADPSYNTTYNLDASKGGQTTVFQNVLYYKSPTFTNSTLHSRANVQFTAVGLNAETTNTSDTTGTKKYYAYYADNNANVYKSLVATATVTGVDAGEDSYATESAVLNRVTDVVGSSNADTGMEQVLINGYSVSQVFKKVVSIECTNDLIVISGEAKQATTPLSVLVGVRQEDGTWDWKGVQLGGFTGIYITDVTTVGGYYYFVAHDNNNNGFLGAVSMEVLMECSKGVTLPNYQNRTTTNDGMLWTSLNATGTPYAIGGRET